jgi:GntR family transcriptional regulator, sialic acid-inducible nan operon repressor
MSVKLDIADRTRPRTATNVVEALIADLKSGAISAGETFPSERALCERFDVSRPTVREALLMLQERGFASLSATRRPRADYPSFAKIMASAASRMRDLLDDREGTAYMEQVRQFIEVGAVRTVVERATPVQITRIHAALEACNVTRDDPVAFKEADIGFHRALVTVVDNPVLLALHDTFARALFDRRPAERDPVKHNALVYDEHRAIFEAIVAHDADRAAAILDAHLDRAYRANLQIERKS